MPFSCLFFFQPFLSYPPVSSNHNCTNEQVAENIGFCYLGTSTICPCSRYFFSGYYAYLDVSMLIKAVTTDQSDADECSAETISDYNMSFRVGSIFIILVTSAVGKLSIVSLVIKIGWSLTDFTLQPCLHPSSCIASSPTVKEVFVIGVLLSVNSVSGRCA